MSSADTIVRQGKVDDMLNIILVEDDDGDAKAIRRAFAKAKIANPVNRCIDGVEALRFLRGESGAPPRKYILLIDINMPRMNGVEFLQELRRDPQLKQAVAFVLTTSNDPRDVSAAYSENIAGYIQKQNAGVDFLNLITTLNCFWKVVELPDLYEAADQRRN